MAMQKIGDIEKGLEVLRGHEAQTLDRLEARYGKRLQEFSDEERKELHSALEEARKRNEEDTKKEAETNEAAAESEQS